MTAQIQSRQRPLVGRHVPALALFDRAADVVVSSDENLGMTWWNGLTEADRRFWCAAALTAVPAAAWAYFKTAAPIRRAFP